MQLVKYFKISTDSFIQTFFTDRQQFYCFNPVVYEVPVETPGNGPDLFFIFFRKCITQIPEYNISPVPEEYINDDKADICDTVQYEERKK